MEFLYYKHPKANLVGFYLLVWTALDISPLSKVLERVWLSEEVTFLQKTFFYTIVSFVLVFRVGGKHCGNAVGFKS